MPYVTLQTPLQRETLAIFCFFFLFPCAMPAAGRVEQRMPSVPAGQLSAVRRNKTCRWPARNSGHQTRGPSPRIWATYFCALPYPGRCGYKSPCTCLEPGAMPPYIGRIGPLGPTLEKARQLRPLPPPRRPGWESLPSSLVYRPMKPHYTWPNGPSSGVEGCSSLLPTKNLFELTSAAPFPRDDPPTQLPQHA